MRHTGHPISDIRTSPSTRRVWIEMGSGRTTTFAGRVALHPEGVDRNISIALIWVGEVASPSTRRARVERKS